jgi:hypothetical protein
MRSPVKPKLMRILLDGEPHREIDRATGVGFTKVATIRKWIESFENAGFIERSKNPASSGYVCRLVTSREIVLKIYHHPEFRTLRPEIRQAPWFCPVFTQPFAVLSDNLPDLIDEMIRASHTFFETLCTYDTPEKIRETYQSAIIVNRLAGISDPAFDDLSIYYQIFVHAVIRDIKYGGLGEGFAKLLAKVQETVKHRYAACYGSVKKKAGSGD